MLRSLIPWWHRQVPGPEPCHPATWVRYDDGSVQEFMADQLRGRTFLSTGVTEGGMPRLMSAGSRVMLWFTADGRLVAGAGCNSIHGRVELSAGQIWVPEMRITEMWCGDDLLAQDQWLASLLSARPSWQLSDPHLRVSTGEAVIELTDRRVLDPDRPLEGTRWVVSALIGGNVTGGASADPSRVFLVFGQGRVTGSDGCQPLSGPAAVSHTTISFGPVRPRLAVLAPTQPSRPPTWPCGCAPRCRAMSVIRLRQTSSP
jgi:heat shock protein HslJ